MSQKNLFMGEEFFFELILNIEIEKRFLQIIENFHVFLLYTSTTLKKRET
jgi:hypothetical protein